MSLKLKCDQIQIVYKSFKNTYLILVTMFLFSEIGEGWEPAFLFSIEYNFIVTGQKTFRNSAPYWIRGSSNRAGNIHNAQ